MTEKKLYKSAERKICGVCGGLAEYFNMDPTIMRIIWAISFCFWGIGLIAYIVAAIVMPDKPSQLND